MVDDPKLLTDSRVAAKLGLRVTWLRNELTSGRLPGVRVGTRWLCEPSAVETVLLERAREWSPEKEGEPK